MLLKDEILKVHSQPIQVKVDDSKRETGLASELIGEIAKIINEITKFNIKQILNEEFSDLMQQNNEIRSQLGLLKNSMFEFMTKTHLEMEKRRSNPEKVVDEFDLLEAEQSKPKPEKSNHLSVQLLKLRQDVDAIRATTQKFSSSSFLQLLQENNEAMNRKIEERYGRLSRELQDVTEKSMSQEHSLERTTSALIESRYEALESQVDNYSDEMKNLIDRQKLFEEALCDKY